VPIRTKLRFYNAVIKPVVSYACEKSIAKKQIEETLLIFEIKILRKIFGPNIQADGSWRIKTNEEFDKLTKRKKIYSKGD
jgi:predicted small secreted protein